MTIQTEAPSKKIFWGSKASYQGVSFARNRLALSCPGPTLLRSFEDVREIVGFFQDRLSPEKFLGFLPMQTTHAAREYLPTIEFLDRFDQGDGIFYRGLLQNAVAEVEDAPRPAVGLIEDYLGTVDQ